MNKRPVSVTVISWVLILACAVGLVYHLLQFLSGGDAGGQDRLQDAVWIVFVRGLGVTAGIFMLRGQDWARWLALLWIAYHVFLSALHSVHATLVHGLLFFVFAYFLLRPPASRFFRGTKAERGNQ